METNFDKQEELYEIESKLKPCPFCGEMPKMCDYVVNLGQEMNISDKFTADRLGSIEVSCEACGSIFLDEDYNPDKKAERTAAIARCISR